MSADHDSGFLSRWSRRKGLAKQGVVVEPVPATTPTPHPSPLPASGARGLDQALPAGGPREQAVSSLAPLAGRGTEGEGPPAEAPPLPTLDDVATLTKDSDFTRFIAPEVAPDVKNAALNKLFHTDPHFNVMDGLDTYIDDYGKPDPIPESMLRQMVQSQMLGLFAHEKQDCPDGAAAADAPQSQPPAEPLTHHEPNPDLQLQPHDAAGHRGPAGGAGQDAGRER